MDPRPGDRGQGRIGTSFVRTGALRRHLRPKEARVGPSIGGREVQVARRADPRRRLHRRRGRIERRPPLHEPPVRGAVRVYAGGATGSPDLVARAAPSRRSGTRAPRRAASRRRPSVQRGLPDGRARRPGRLGPRHDRAGSRRVGGAPLLPGSDVRRHRAEASGAGAGTGARHGAHGRRALARGRRHEEHVPDRRVARPAHTAVGDPRECDHAGERRRAGDLRRRIADSSSGVSRRRRSASRRWSTTCSISIA